MKLPAFLLVTMIVLGLTSTVRGAWLSVGDTRIAEYCINWSDEAFPMTHEPPYGAVGYLSNGCTATLLEGGQHILTAAHCIVSEYDDSDYWTHLAWTKYAPIYFYPNYHEGALAPPAPVTAFPSLPAPPRVPIERAVLGAHANTGGQYYPSDWAIARLAQPVTAFPSLPFEDQVPGPALDPLTPSRPVVVPNYSRDPVQYGDPNNHYFTGWCGVPPYTGELGCSPGWGSSSSPGIVFGNAWWRDALLSKGMQWVDRPTAYSYTDAPGVGGSSGSPHLVQQDDQFVIAGVTHGGYVPDDGCAGVAGPAAVRFAHAPWFARSVAVATAPSSANRTGVFVLDTDRSALTFRERVSDVPTCGAAPCHYVPFDFFQRAGGVPGGFTKIAAFELGGTGLPGVVALGQDGQLLEIDREGDSWSSWKAVAGPARGTVQDIDAAYGEDGVNRLYAVTSPGGLYVKTRESGAAGADWRPWWFRIAGQGGRDPYTQVTAVRHEADGLNQAWMLTSRGVIHTVREFKIRILGSLTVTLWTPAAEYAAPPAGPGGAAANPIIGIDAGWNSQGAAMLVVLRKSGAAWYREAESTMSRTSWSSWRRLPARLDPGIATIDDKTYDLWVNRDGVTLASITASRFVEPVAGQMVPVVFATDTWGNVYQTNGDPLSGAWSNWVPFYGKRLNSAQAIGD